MLLLSSINLQSAVSLVNFMLGDREFDARKVYNLTTNWLKYINVWSRLSTCGFTLSADGVTTPLKPIANKGLTDLW